MVKKRVASASIGAVSVVGSTVVAMIWPTLDPVIGIPILWGCLAIFLASLVLWFWPEKPFSGPQELHPDYIAEAARQKAKRDAETKDALGQILGGMGQSARQVAKDLEAQREAERLRVIADALRPKRDRRAEFREERRLKQIETDKHRRAIISACRDIVPRYRDADLPKPFGEFVNRERAFLDIQPHLGNEYWKGVLGRAELKGVQDEAPRRDHEAGMFLRELARLEKEWGL